MGKKFLLLVLLILPVSLTIAQKQLINVQTIDKVKFERMIKERNGKVLLLNFWATWCVPCREEFPDLVKIASEFSSAKVEVIGISLDFPEEVRSKIIPFLKSQKANFTNYVNGFKKDDELIDLVNEKWNGALPATVVYDEDGNQIAFLEGKKSYSDFKILLNKLVN